jgi:branched-subunit amino acid transport protein
MWATLLPLETGHELALPPWAIGVLAFVLLAILMLITLAIGKGRPHS